MKKFFVLLSMSLCVSMYTTAQTTSKSTTTFLEYDATGIRMPLIGVKEINLTDVYQQVEIRGDITVILINEPAGKLLVRGNPKDLNCIKATVKDRKLLIDAQRKRTFDKLTIYISVINAASLVTNGETEIFSQGTIKAKDLKIILNGHSRISVNYDGKLKIVPGEGYELAYK